MLLFPAFEALDVFGPLGALNGLSRNYSMNLYLISNSTDPVSTALRVNPQNSNFSESIVPTHTFENPPPKLDILFVPGGGGTRAPDLDRHIAYIRDTYPSLQYILSVCTGSWLLARAGVLDGKNATSNKRAWAGREALGNGTKWIAHARWVTDGNVWTSSGVSAGIDATLAWVSAVYGDDVASGIANGMEYPRHTNASVCRTL
ncbi:hypothetical protein VNI00_005911 [Paramarasmius palmivorus]|uniref:DJ-1/PfpI domain-containing protein n=1 Tax=Paramarasmius palmivorus TaxID=297713 RepID=A0AAW0DG09_9AGAR